jgi:hypothetical protein
MACHASAGLQGPICAVQGIHLLAKLADHVQAFTDIVHMTLTKPHYVCCCTAVALHTLPGAAVLQGTSIGSLSSVDMLFKFIKPLVEEGEDDEDMDDEVR